MTGLRLLPAFLALSAPPLFAHRTQFGREAKDEVVMNVRPGLNTPLFKEIHLDLVDLGDLNGPEIRGDDDKADRELAALKQIRRAALPLYDQGAVLAVRKGQDVIVLSGQLTPYSKATLISLRRPDQPARTIQLTQDLAAQLQTLLPHQGSENVGAAHAALRDAFDGAARDRKLEPFSTAVPEGGEIDRIRADEDLRTLVDEFVMEAEKHAVWRGAPLSRPQLETLARHTIDEAFAFMKPSIGKYTRQDWLRRWRFAFKKAWAKAPGTLLKSEGQQMTRALRLWPKVQAKLIDSNAGKILLFRLRDWMGEYALAGAEANPPPPSIDWKKITTGAKYRAALGQLRSIAKEFAGPLSQAVPVTKHYLHRDVVGQEIVEQLLNETLTDVVAQMLANPRYKDYDTVEKRRWLELTLKEAWHDSLDDLAKQVHDRPMSAVPPELQLIFFHSMQKNLAAWRYLEDLEFDWPEVQEKLLQTPQAHNLLDRFAEWVIRHHPAD